MGREWRRRQPLASSRLRCLLRGKQLCTARQRTARQRDARSAASPPSTRPHPHTLAHTPTTTHKTQSYHTAHGGDLAQRKARYTDMVNKYYDLATSFYEYGEL